MPAEIEDRQVEQKTAIAGIQSCGCITYANSEPARLNADDRKALAKIVASGGEVRRMSPDEIRADPNFLPGSCPHEPKGWEVDRGC